MGTPVILAAYAACEDSVKRDCKMLWAWCVVKCSKKLGCHQCQDLVSRCVCRVVVRQVLQHLRLFNINLKSVASFSYKGKAGSQLENKVSIKVNEEQISHS